MNEEQQQPEAEQVQPETAPEAAPEAATGAAPEDAPKAEAEAAAQDAPEQEAAPENPELSALRQALDKAKQQVDEYISLAQHVQADFNNFRRRNESARADSFADGQRKAVTEMLPVLDNLERALASSSEESPLRSGIELTLKQMHTAFDKLGVTEIACEGQKFDPNLENAVMQGTPEDGEPGTVCMVLMKGYSMGGAVLRHAMVKVVPD